MKVWVDAQLSPYIALFINRNFKNVEAVSVRSLGMISASDYQIFKYARNEAVVMMSKDADFVKLIELYDVPPHLIWITCGNTSNIQITQILTNHLAQALDLIIGGEKIVEISS